jgi:hypothetical protein
MKPEIIHLALEQLQQETGITARYLDEGLLQLKGEGKPMQFVVIYKDEPRNYQLAEFVSLKEQQKHMIVIARQLFPGIRERLYANDIAYLDTQGNMFLKAPGIYILVEGKKTTQRKATHGNRAFTATGLKVLFQLLQNKDLVNAPQRTIAQKAGVALGNIKMVLDGLKETGYLIPLNKKEYLWENRQELLQRWAENYATLLRPRLIKGRYRLTQPWQEIRLNTPPTVWGGEPAADLLTHHLRPEQYTLYTKETATQLLKNYRLIPDKTGDLEVLERFWPQTREEATAPALLIYADLLGQGSKRNLETAKIIYHEHIQPNL